MTTDLAKYEPDKAQSVAEQAALQAQVFDSTMRAMAIPSAQWAVAAAKQVRERRRSFESERDSMAKPLRKLATEHSKRWNPTIKLLEGLEKYLKGEALALEQAARAEQIAALQAAKSADEIVAAAAPVDSGLGKRSDWSWELMNEAEVPDEYWVLDKLRIDREARERKAELDIPGIRAVERVTGVLR